jgi:asparagine synthase (glutamine-hydrolysing)
LAVRDEEPLPASIPDAIWVAIDGFLTNRAELARALELPPQACQTEVVGRAFKRWGGDCLSRFRGQWAVIVCDLRRATLLAARDHTGVGQLYFAAEDDLVFVASEPKAVAAARRCGLEIDPSRFGAFLNGFPPTTEGPTFFRGVTAVPPGALLEATLDQGGKCTTRTRAFWEPAKLPGWSLRPPSFEDAVQQLEEALFEGVGQRLSERRTGALLSGGLDSSVVASMAARHLAPEGHLPTFSILHVDPNRSEERFIRAVVEHAVLESHGYTISTDDAWQAIDTVVKVQGEPLLGQDLIGQWHAYRLAAETGAQAVFDGVGADELFAGVGTEPKHLCDLLFRGRIVALLGELRALSHRQSVSLSRALKRSLLVPIKRELTWSPTASRYAWISRDIPVDPHSAVLREDVPPDRSLLNRYLYLHLRHQNAPTIVARLDRCAAAHGLRPLLPFLDLRIVELCLPLPGHYKMSGAQPKRLLHAVAQRYLPAAVSNRRDKKAIVSSGEWMPLRSEYADVVRAVPSEQSIRESGWIEPRAAGRFMEDYLAGVHHDHLAVWRLITAWRWLEMFQLS